MGMTNSKTVSAPTYRLGMITGGREYLFTDLPGFVSGMAARDYALSVPRSGVWTVFEERDISRLGVCYGLQRVAVATVPAP